MKQPRLPNVKSETIIIKDLETKKRLIDIGDRTGETLKDIVKRLVEADHKRINKARM